MKKNILSLVALSASLMISTKVHAAAADVVMEGAAGSGRPTLMRHLRMGQGAAFREIWVVTYDPTRNPDTACTLDDYTRQTRREEAFYLEVAGLTLKDGRPYVAIVTPRVLKALPDDVKERAERLNPITAEELAACFATVANKIINSNEILYKNIALRSLTSRAGSIDPKERRAGEIDPKEREDALFMATRAIVGDLVMAPLEDCPVWDPDNLCQKWVRSLAQDVVRPLIDAAFASPEFCTNIQTQLAYKERMERYKERQEEMYC